MSDTSLKPALDSYPHIIRLRTKYQVDSLRKRALVHLSSAFPSPFDPTSFSPDPGSASSFIEDNRWIWIIVLDREMSLDWILPFALYRACAMCSRPTDEWD
jgi:hypothetical protein